MGGRRRLDAELVRRGLVDSRVEATTLIAAGRVLVAGAAADKAARQVSPADPIVVTGPPQRFVSRGGEKLDAALDHFAVDVRGRRILDAGASTGGFTDCVLQRGARQVVALDVGHGQLHPRIRDDPRVLVVERFNVRALRPESIGGPVDMVVADLSFISLTKVLAPLVGACRPGGPMVLLVKPQFEAGRRDVARGRGIVTDPVLWQAACDAVDVALRDHGCTVNGWLTSPLVGGQGNVEFLVHATTPTAIASSELESHG